MDATITIAFRLCFQEYLWAVQHIILTYIFIYIYILKRFQGVLNTKFILYEQIDSFQNSSPKNPLFSLSISTVKVVNPNHSLIGYGFPNFFHNSANATALWCRTTSEVRKTRDKSVLVKGIAMLQGLLLSWKINRDACLLNPLSHSFKNHMTLKQSSTHPAWVWPVRENFHTLKADEMKQLCAIGEFVLLFLDCIQEF